MTMKYEDFVQEPELYLKRIGQFIGIGDISLTKKIEPSINDKYFQQWRALEQTPKGCLDTGFSSLFFESQANRYGYSFREGHWLTKDDSQDLEEKDVVGISVLRG